uniref:Uncharacterized protein n=1 Tax=Arundo donax TaxID=35708 RepID=A0A0A9G3E3_ARUDO
MLDTHLASTKPFQNLTKVMRISGTSSNNKC